MLLRLFVNTNVYVGSVLVCYEVIKFAYRFAMRILGYSGRRATMLSCINPLKLWHLMYSFFFPNPGV